MLPASSSSSSSEQKRKYTEYHDPDYPNECPSDEVASTSAASSSKRARNNQAAMSTTAAATTAPTPSDHDADAQAMRIRDVITREFDREIEMKQQQLELADKRLTEAFTLLNRLRYQLVGDYYRRQEPPLAEAQDAAVTVRGENTLFEDEYRGPQMALHPAIKKIIGKQPRSYKEILRQNPEPRAAALSARTMLRERSQTERRLERQRQKMIRERGIIIDHTKVKVEANVDDAASNSTNSDVLRLAATPAAAATTTTSAAAATTATATQLPGETIKALNTSRHNNKMRHVIVIGNTSKYIGAEEAESGWQAPKSNEGRSLSHKWLVYVQSKDPAQPIENYVTKVRFFLDTSYRPNDIVDICAPPFRLTRRGWGEFPVRIQLHFHAHLRQKPVQLMHQLVLDKTLTGRQTLGAETMVEVWLRSADDVRRAMHAQSLADPSPATDSTLTMDTMANIDLLPSLPLLSRHPRTISFTQCKEDLDDNLFDFLNNSAASGANICADIDKIQPTVIVTEPLAMLPPSPSKLLAPANGTTIMDSLFNQNNLTTTNNTSNNHAAIGASSRQDMASTSGTTIRATPTPLIRSPLTEVPAPTIVTIPRGSAAPIVSASISTTVSPSLATVTPSTIPTTSVPRQGVAQILKIDTKSLNSAPPVSLALKAKTQSSQKIVLNLSSAGSAPYTATGQVKLHPVAVVPTKAGSVPSAKPSASPILKPLGTNGSVPQVLQKKWVQLVDSKGNVKRVQMLVASASKASTTATTLTTPAVTVAQGHTVATPASLNTKPVTSTSTKPLCCEVLIKGNNSVNDRCPGSPSNAAASKPPAAPIGSRNGQQATPPKNVVFQREGKLYLIDPQQIKLRQQQRKQVSLLKPQVSLLRQQNQLQPQQPSLGDHDYAPPSSTPPASATPPASSTPPSTSTPPAATAKKQHLPPVHLGVRQTRVNATVQRVQRRQRFQQSILRAADFESMRTAVEYLLRRLPLIVTDCNDEASDFPFVYQSQTEFDALPVLKQRASEWLRAKYIESWLRKHMTLDAAPSSAETFWSTREIVVFARWHAYTPSLKKLELPPFSNSAKTAAEPSAATPFTLLVKSELQQQQEQRLLQRDTLTDQAQLSGWVDEELARVQQCVAASEAEEIIDIEGVEERKVSKRSAMQAKEDEQPTTAAAKTFLPLSATLDNAGELVSDICRDRSIRLEPEELCEGIVQPAALTVLSHCLKMFVERLIRRSVAAKVQSQPSDSCDYSDVKEGLTIGLQDVGKVLAQDDEYDFLTNQNFGVLCPEEEKSGGRDAGDDVPKHE